MVSWIASCMLVAALTGQADCTIVYFGSAQCEPCERMMPALAQLKQEGWDIRAVNPAERPDLATQYKIENLPTVVIVSAEPHKEVDRIVGAVSYEQLASRFARAAARSHSGPAGAASELRPVVAASAVARPTVRGQSPGIGGFAMLSAGTVAPSVSVATGSTLASSTPSMLTPVASTPSSTPNTTPASTASQSASAQATSAPVATPLTLEQAIARAAAATVRIKVEESNTTAYGTGTIIDVHGSEALVLTCGHLFRDMKPGSQLSVDLFAGTPQEVSALAQLIDFKAEGEDIGLISFQLPVPIEAVEILPRNEQLQIGQGAFSFGCDHGNDPTRRDTKVCNINRFIGAANVEIVGAPAVGRSGGGLFDLQGRLIGVCNAADAGDDQGIYAAAEVVYTQIERLGLAHLFDQTQSPPVQLASTQVGAGQTGAGQAPQSELTTSPQPVSENSGEWSNAADSSTPQPNDPIAWPDQSSAVAATTPSGHAGAAAQEIICIVRDAQGQSRVVKIAGPSRELLSAIEQQSVAQ